MSQCRSLLICMILHHQIVFIYHKLSCTIENIKKKYSIDSHVKISLLALVEITGI